MATVTPLWFIILMAILTFIILISVIGIFVANNKVKKGSGYDGKSGSSKGGGTTCP